MPRHAVTLTDAEEDILVAGARARGVTPAACLETCVKEMLMEMGRRTLEADQGAIQRALSDPAKVAAMRAALER